MPFAAANTVYVGDGCMNLPAYKGPMTYEDGQTGQVVQSVWLLTEAEVESLRHNPHLVVTIQGTDWPPLSLQVGSPVT